MSAKRFALVCSAVGVLLTAASAQSPTPEPLPAPRPVTQPRQVIVQATGYEISDELHDQVRLALDVCPAACGRPPVGGASWTLAPREARIFDAFLRASKPACDTLSRPQLTLTDNQTGMFQVGQKHATVNELQQVSYAHSGIALRVTPRFLPGGTVRLTTDIEHSAPAAEPVVLADGTTTTPIDVHCVQTTTELPVGHTVVVGGLTAPGTEKGREAKRIVWRFTVTEAAPGR